MYDRVRLLKIVKTVWTDRYEPICTRTLESFMDMEVHGQQKFEHGHKQGWTWTHR